MDYEHDFTDRDHIARRHAARAGDDLTIDARAVVTLEIVDANLVVID